jgi:hypothetical protein
VTLGQQAPQASHDPGQPKRFQRLLEALLSVPKREIDEKEQERKAKRRAKPV